jgi:hypothetical protein
MYSAPKLKTQIILPNARFKEKGLIPYNSPTTASQHVLGLNVAGFRQNQAYEGEIQPVIRFCYSCDWHICRYVALGSLGPDPSITFQNYLSR